MSLFSKVRVLIGALVHAPFTPRPERAAPDDGPAPRRGLEKDVPAPADEGRVADLIEKRKEGGEP